MWKDKIEQAKNHKKTLDAQLSAFLASNPYIVATKIDPKTHCLVYYIKSAKPVPVQIALTTGDIIQNLRSSLDHLAYQLFIQDNEGSSGKHIYFPIAENASKYKEIRIPQTKGISSTAVELIDSIKSYKEGNYRLWQIHELNRIDKHRNLFTVGSSLRSIDLGTYSSTRAFPGEDFPVMPGFYMSGDPLFLNVGTELFIGAPNEASIPNLGFRFDISLNEPGIVEPEPILDSVQAMIHSVEELMPIFLPAGMSK